MYKQLRETKKIQHIPRKACVSFVMAFRNRNGTSHQAPDLPTSVSATAEWTETSTAQALTEPLPFVPSIS